MSVLGTAARALGLGQYVELAPAGGLAFLHDTLSGGNGTILEYVDKLAWNPILRRAYMANSDDPGDYKHFGYYNESTHAFVEIAQSMWGPPNGSNQRNHTYGQTAMNVLDQEVWIGNGSVTVGGPVRYNLAANTLTAYPGMNNGGQDDAPSGDYFPERGSYVWAAGTRLSERVQLTGAWNLISGSINTSYQSVCHYNPFYKCVVFGCGNEAGPPPKQGFYRLNLNGTVDTLAAPLQNLDSVRYKFTLNPITGDWLVYGYSGTSGSRIRYRFTPTGTGVWTDLGINANGSYAAVPAAMYTPASASGAYPAATFTVPEHKVNVIITAEPLADARMWLFKYAA